MSMGVRTGANIRGHSSRRRRTGQSGRTTPSDSVMAPSGTSPDRNSGSSRTRGVVGYTVGNDASSRELEGEGQLHRRRRKRTTGAALGRASPHPKPSEPARPGAPRADPARRYRRIRRSDSTDYGPDVRGTRILHRRTEACYIRPCYPVETSCRYVRRDISPATTASSECPSRRPGPLFHPTIPPPSRRSCSDGGDRDARKPRWRWFVCPVTGTRTVTGSSNR